MIAEEVIGESIIRSYPGEENADSDLEESA
jgi:hypothetical protein